MNELIRYIDQEDLQDQRLKIQKQSTIFSDCGREGKLTGLAAIFKKYSEKENEQNIGNSNKKSVFIGFVHGMMPLQKLFRRVNLMKR
jgi:hypothetical protein